MLSSVSLSHAGHNAGRDLQHLPAVVASSFGFFLGDWVKKLFYLRKREEHEMKGRDLTLIVLGVAAGAGIATLFSKKRGEAGTNINDVNRLQDDEPWPSTGDDFLALPGRLRAAGFEPPARNTYCKLSFNATTDVPQRILVKQGGRLVGEDHSGGRVVGRYFGDERIPIGEAFFESDGEDIYFEFQEYHEEIKAWRAYRNTIQDTGDDTNREFTMRGARASFKLEWGPRIVRPRPVDPRQPEQPRPAHGFLWVGGKVKCKNIFLGSVQTSYAFAWATATNDPNGPKLAVPELSVSFVYDDFPHGPISNSARNTSEVVASEQIRRAPGNCSDYTVTARGVGPDGVPYEPKTTRMRA